MRRIFHLILLPAIAASVSAAEFKPVFHATFDHDFRAETSKGTVTGKHSHDLNMESLSTLMQQGVKGKAAKVGIDLVNGKADGNMIRYPGEVVNAETGTIAFWLKPLDWDFQDARGKVEEYLTAAGFADGDIAEIREEDLW